MYIKYGRFYISWVNLNESYFAVDTKDKAMWFNSEDEIKKVMQILCIDNYEVER